MCDSGAVTTHDPAAAVRRQAVSVSVATGLYGVAFGALSVAAGVPVPQTLVLGLLIVILVVAFPRGIVGSLQALMPRLRPRPAAPIGEAALRPAE